MRGICLTLYPEMKIKMFSNIQPETLVHNSNSGEMEAFYRKSAFSVAAFLCDSSYTTDY